MPRINPLAAGDGDAATTNTLNAVKAKLGMVPNLFATFARAPAALNGYLALSDALSKGRLDARQREIIALVVAQANECQYCLSAHTALGKGAGLSDSAVLDARAAKAADALDQALATLALRIVRQRGALTDQDVVAARSAGISDELLLEVIANVALNVLTNYTNHIAATEVDFPAVPPAVQQAA